MPAAMLSRSQIWLTQVAPISRFLQMRNLTLKECKPEVRDVYIRDPSFPDAS